MNTKTMATLLGLGGWAALGACTSGTDNPPLVGAHPPHVDGGSSGSSGGSSGGSGSGSGGGQGDDGSTASDDGGPIPDSGPYDGPVTPPTDAAMISPTCRPNQTWGSATNVAGVPGFASQPLVTVTNDELTVAWVVDAGGGQGTVFYADRASTSAPFGTAQQLMAAPAGGDSYYVDGALVTDGGDDYFAFDRVALSSDGLRLVGVAIGGLHMAEYDRPTRTAGFSATSLESNYSDLTTALMAGEKLGDPVLAPGGGEFVYSRYGLSPSVTVYDSHLISGQTWPPGSGEETTALEGANGHRKHPTAMTADRLTLFVWDDAGQAYGVLRGTTNSQFNYAISFGARFSIQVNGACSRIYFVGSDGGSGYVLQQADAM